MQKSHPNRAGIRATGIRRSNDAVSQTGFAVTRTPQPPLKPLPDFSSMSDAEIAQTSVRLLREATVEVFHRMGAADWLYELARSDPKNFLKMLQRLLPQTIEATVAVQPFEVPKAIRELTLEDLRAMRRSIPTGGATGAPVDIEFTMVKP